MKRLMLITVLLMTTIDANAQPFPRCGVTRGIDGRPRLYPCSEYGPYEPAPSTRPNYEGWRGDNYPWARGWPRATPRHFDHFGNPYPYSEPWWR